MRTGSDSGSDQRLKRALLAHVRQDFSAPVGAIVGYAEILMEEVPHHGFDRFAPDLARIHQAGLALQQLIDGLLDPAFLAKRAADGDYEAFRGRLRHDLRTPMNAIKGYGEMLLEDAQAVHADVFVGDLEKMLGAAKRLLTRIDSLVELTRADRPGDAGPTSVAFDRVSQAVRPIPDETIAARQAGPCRILVVDDHQSNRDLLARRLTRDGHEIVTAGNGDGALTLVEEGGFDLILLDLLMPGMSGYEVLCRLKSHPRHAEIPVIMISALDETDSVVRCIEAGAEDYMPKPFDPVLLRARINSCLEKKRLRDREKVMTQQLRMEKEKSEVLLLNVLPKPIVARLQRGENVIADRVPDATILFADLVGFTSLSTRLPAAQLVNLLNLLFTDFDRLSIQFGLEKIKTIGDAYMVAGGLLEARADHAAATADMALAMLESVRLTGDRLNEPLRVRIGMHTGPVLAGIIGTHKFIYDIWGDTVNTASRLESQGAIDRINVSAEIHRRLQDRFLIEPCEVINLRGKGPTQAYFLRGRRATGR
ncbi:MAG: adenylate cyclase [Rhodospirillaceae bacterium]|nr:adenylate cyclase [Rhodospirillaceae bacterium]